jgi:GTP cyclohydrolase I
MSAPDPLAAQHFAQALELLGFVGDPEMDNTAARVIEFLAEFRPQPAPSVTPLETRSQSPVVIRDLLYHSLCAHHLLPFFGTCTIAYRPSGAIAGLGWFPRLVEHLARQPQLQERFAEQIAHGVFEALSPQSVAVFVSARQMCVEMRGARAHGAFEVTAVAGAEDNTLLNLVQPR